MNKGLATLVFGMVPLWGWGGGAGKTPDRLQGYYKVVRSVISGKEIPQDTPTFVVFDGSVIKVLEEGDFDKGKDLFSFKLLPETDPRGIDFFHLDGPRKNELDQGIYRVEGKNLTICIQDGVGAGRPKAFESKAGSRMKLIVLEKVR